jgi:hypothetical protein
LGLSLNTSNNKNETLRFFILNCKNDAELKRFTKYALLGCNIKTDKDKYYEEIGRVRDILRDRKLYLNSKNHAYWQLLRMNVNMSNRKFNFEMFKSKSLEHICPQKPDENHGKKFLKTLEDIDKKSDGIHSIGNIVLLDGPQNSSLKNLPFNQKKNRLFDNIKKGFLLPHTLKVFSKSFSESVDDSFFEYDPKKYWLTKDVRDNKDYFFEQFDAYYYGD